MIRQLILSVCERMLERERMRQPLLVDLDVFVSDVMITFVSKVPLS